MLCVCVQVCEERTKSEKPCLFYTRTNWIYLHHQLARTHLMTRRPAGNYSIFSRLWDIAKNTAYMFNENKSQIWMPEISIGWVAPQLIRLWITTYANTNRARAMCVDRWRQAKGFIYILVEFYMWLVYNVFSLLLFEEHHICLDTFTKKIKY